MFRFVFADSDLDSEGFHFAAKLVRVAVKNYARHTGALRALDVRSGVIDKQAFAGDETEGLAGI